MSFANEYNYSALKKEFKSELPSIKKRFAKEKEMVCISCLSIDIQDIFNSFQSKCQSAKFTQKTFEEACKKAYRTFVKDLRNSNETTKKIQEITISSDENSYHDEVYLYGFSHESLDEFTYRILLELKAEKDAKEAEEYQNRRKELEHKLQLQDLIGSIKRLSNSDKDYVLTQVGDEA